MFHLQPFCQMLLHNKTGPNAALQGESHILIFFLFLSREASIYLYRVFLIRESSVIQDSILHSQVYLFRK